MPLIMQYFIVFRAFKALSYWVFVLFYLFFLLLEKNPIKGKKPTRLGFLKKPGFFEPWPMVQPADIPPPQSPILWMLDRCVSWILYSTLRRRILCWMNCCLEVKFRRAARRMSSRQLQHKISCKRYLFPVVIGCLNRPHSTSCLSIHLCHTGFQLETEKA